jgi:hypothetical protein
VTHTLSSESSSPDQIEPDDRAPNTWVKASQPVLSRKLCEFALFQDLKAFWGTIHFHMSEEQRCCVSESNAA